MTAKLQIVWHVCTDSIEYSAGAHETLEMLDGMLHSLTTLSRAALSRAAPSKAAEQSCTLLGEMLDLFDQGLSTNETTLQKEISSLLLIRLHGSHSASLYFARIPPQPLPLLLNNLSCLSILPYHLLLRHTLPISLSSILHLLVNYRTLQCVASL